MASQGLHAEAARQLSIAIGQVPLTLHFPEGDLRQRAEQRYAPFCATGDAALPVWLGPARGAEDPREFSYALDGATVRIEDDAIEFGGVRHEWALDSLIRILLSHLLLPRKGFLLHAASVLRGGRAYVFTGRSGSGKSTVASLSPEGTVLTDEISLVRFAEGAWRAYGTPFWGEFRAAGLNRAGEIAGVYVLEQAREDRVEPLSAKDALRALLPNVLFFSSRRGETDTLLGILAEATGQIPFYRLHFRRTPDFWRAIA